MTYIKRMMLMVEKGVNRFRYLEEWVENGRQLGSCVGAVLIRVRSGAGATSGATSEGSVRTRVPAAIIRRRRALLAFHRLHSTQVTRHSSITFRPRCALPSRPSHQ